MVSRSVKITSSRKRLEKSYFASFLREYIDLNSISRFSLSQLSYLYLIACVCVGFDFPNLPENCSEGKIHCNRPNTSSNVCSGG